MDGAGLGVLAGVLLGGLGYLARQLDRLRSDVREEFGRFGGEIGGLRGEIGGLRSEVHEQIGLVRADVRSLADAYIRHLEHHAGR